MTDTLVPPSDTEYSVFLQQKTQAESQLAQLQFQRELEKEAAPSKNHTNLLEYLNRGNAKRITGKNLADAIYATEAALRVADRLLDDFNERQEAFIEARTVPAPEC